MNAKAVAPPEKINQEPADGQASEDESLSSNRVVRPRPEPSYGTINEAESRLGLWQTLKLAMRDQSKLAHD